MAQSSKLDSRFLIGFIFVVVGAYLLLVNLDLLPFTLPDYILSWKTLLIAIGLLIVATRENKGGGITLIAVGGIFLVTDILNITFGELIREVWLFWPAVFIIIGLALILRRSREKKTEDEDGFRPNESADDYTEITAIVGGNNKIIYSRSFRGARLTAIMGGVDINLINARLAPGRHEIDVFALFGGSTIIIPNDWNVRLDVTPIVGGFEDKRSFPQSYVANADTELIIRGVVIFGGGEIKSS
jgi:predicted membrane protein